MHKIYTYILLYYVITLQIVHAARSYSFEVHGREGIKSKSRGDWLTGPPPT